MDLPVKTKDENEARVAEEYLSSLSDLTCNSKPLINMLTMLAEENIAYASVIVKVVEQHISKVPPDIKLPLLYLIDSIVKNVKSTYIHLFSQCIVNIFCDVFEKVNEKIRERMYALRLTWNEVFPSQKLYALDVKVKRIDNNWPITAKQSQPSIHVNPNFLKSVGNVQAGDVEEILQAKTRELLELKKRKLELELEATKKSLEEQDKQLTKVTNGIMPPEAKTISGLRISGVPPQLMPPGMITTGMIQPHPMHPRPPQSMLVAGGGPGGSAALSPAALFHPNFQHIRPQQPQLHGPVAMMPVPPQNFASASSGNKPKVHPVNPALLNTIRQRDPRLVRQQQMQETKLPSSPSRSLDESQKSSSSKSSAAGVNRNAGSSKSSRNDGGRGGSNSDLESNRHSSYSSSERYRRRSSSRDKDRDKDRRRIESKSSTSSGVSNTSERNKSSSSSSAAISSSNRSSKRDKDNKCDKDAFEIAPLSSAFKPKSDSSSSASSRKKESKRKHSTHSSPNTFRNRSRSRSPSQPSSGNRSTMTLASRVSGSILSDKDERHLAPVFSPKKQLKGNTTDSEPERDVKEVTEKANSKSIAKTIEDKNIEIVADGNLAIAAKTDIDLRHFPPITAYKAELGHNVVVVEESEVANKQNFATTTTTPITTTTITPSSKVSFKIQKLYNKIDKSTASQPILDNDEDMPEITSTSTPSPTITAITTEKTAAALLLAPKVEATTIDGIGNTIGGSSLKSEAVTSKDHQDDDDESGGGGGAGGKESGIDRVGSGSSSDGGGGNGAATIGIDIKSESDGVLRADSVSVKRQLSIDSSEQPMLKVKTSPPSPVAVEGMDVDLGVDEEKVSNEEKKRLSTSTTDLEEPLAKKSKSAKFDALFGNEDVDLRTGIPPQILAAQQQLQPKPERSVSKSPTPPPPPFITDDHNAESWKEIAKSTKKTSDTKKSSNLDDVRAKLAKATKYSKFNKAEKSSKETSQRLKLSEANQNDDSQDANDEKIRTIVAQAQELLENKSINQDQYKNLMQKVMSINETSKLKEAKKRESLNSSKAPSKRSNDDENQEEERHAAARDAILKKRIPKLIRNSPNAMIDNTSSSMAESVDINPSFNKSPIHEERSNDNTDMSSARSKQQRERKRQKPSKWGDKADGPTVAAASVVAGIPSGVMRPHHVGTYRGGAPPPPVMPSMPPQIPWQIQMPPVMPPGAPFVNPGAMIRSSVPPPPPAPPVLPIIPLPPNIPKPCNSIDNPQADLVRTITIDGLSKEIRIYDQVAIVFMELDQPREIGFQAGQRSIIIDNEAPIALQFNDDYKAFTIQGQLHRLRFGFPSRELYIDEHWYEIYFGGPPVSIPIQNRMHILKAEGPPPQVNIGALRRDLVVGKINMIVDAHIVIPLFLDAKPQSFKLGNQDHTVQFADNLLTVLLDGEPAKVEYGGLPKSYVLGGISYFIRFGALPQGLKAGQIVIKDMVYVNTEPPMAEPIAVAQTVSATKQEESDNKDQVIAVIKNDNEATKADEEMGETSNVSAKDVVKAEGEQSEPQVVGTAGSGNTAIPIFSATALNQINIDELFQKLVSSGILGGGSSSGGAGSAGTVAVSSNKDVGVLPSAASVEEEPPQPVAIRPIDLSKSETIKTRQTAIVDTLFSGMQCSSCGLRFPPEQTIKYSQHLDWHFRQNRRERDLSRKAHSRKWYYDLADWVQYEEIEDLEEREKNFFESQQGDIDVSDETSNQKWANSPVALSCPALPEDVDRACDMCQEKFEQFYNEETEEWHLRNATRVEDKIYHPLCYDDYKASLIAKEEEKDEKAKDGAAEETNADDVVIIKIEGDDHSDVEGKLVITEDDDDDVIVLPNEEPSVTEIDDDDDDEDVPQVAEKDTIAIDTEEEKEVSADADVDAAGSDVEIQEPNIPFTDLDTYEEKEQPGIDETAQMPFSKVKIKQEPKDEYEDEDDGFEDVGTVLATADEEISIHSSEETQTQTINSSTSGMSPTADRPASSQSIIQIDCSEPAEAAPTNTAASTDTSAPIDGNTGTEDEHNLSTVGPAPAIPLASLVNKIKINIAKSNSAASTSSSSNTLNNNNNNNANINSSGSASLSGTSTLTTNVGGSSSSPVRMASSDDNDNVSRREGATPPPSLYSNVSAISVVSTIPVLCGGGMIGGRTTTVTPNLSAANEESNVSTISVIGSYGSSSTPRYFPPSTTMSNTVAAKRQNPPRTTTPPLPAPTPTPTPVPQEEETITYELKPALKNAKLTKMKKLQVGVETSGLCSIM